MKKVLIEKLDSFAAAPFTIQRISELLSDPRKQYSRIDKFMRAVEKTILVVSTVPPGRHRSESENGDSLDSALNGDFATEVNVDVEMEHEGTAKELAEGYQRPVVATTAPETIAAENKVSQPKPEVGETSKEPETKLSTVEPSKEIETAVVADKPNEEPTKIDEKVEVPETPTVISSPTKEETKSEVAVAVVEPATSTELTVKDEELSNKPILPADNEILVDASSEISSEPTPLAALENIVAIRTEPVSEATEPIEQQTPNETESAPEPETSKVEEVVPVQITPEEEETATESKRLKISESEDVEKAEEKTEEVVAEAPTPPTVDLTADVTVVPIAEVPTVSLPVVEIPEVKPTIEQAASIAELAPAVVQIPIEDVRTTEDIAEAPATEMETVPIVTENTMSLDEDEPPTTELEMTPIASKMDTDEADAAPMDCEDEPEPMDQ